MEKAVTQHIEITMNWHPLDEGGPEECACFGALGIYLDAVSLTEGHDTLVNVVRKTSYLSGYHLAEWLAWNWWRLRWEPNSSYPEWAFGHQLSTIGSGYIWPNITIFSDGERTVLMSKATEENSNVPFRYLSDFVSSVRSIDFEAAIDQFIEAIRGRLRDEHVKNTNLDTLWSDITHERQDPKLARQRKLEALLGKEPDEVADDILCSLLKDLSVLGESVVLELAAGHTKEGAVQNFESLSQMAGKNGFEASPNDAFKFQAGTQLPQRNRVAAWKLGVEAAKAVREQAGLENVPISDQKLSELIAVKKGAIDEAASGAPIAFALDEKDRTSRIVFRSKWKTGRRFELARILGDRVVSGVGSPLFPATSAHTYRQKMQRSFAAELLSPFEQVIAELDGDYSDEAQQEVAESFDVSPLTIRTMLINNGRIGGEGFETEMGNSVT